VSDMILQYVDSLMAERIKSLARERQWTVNDVLLHALRNGLGISAAQQYSEGRLEPGSFGDLEGHWEAHERGVFQEALHALAQTRPTQLAPESIRPLESAGLE
jgi:hypothetical protein